MTLAKAFLHLRGQAVVAGGRLAPVLTEASKMLWKRPARLNVTRCRQSVVAADKRREVRPFRPHVVDLEQQAFNQFLLYSEIPLLHVRHDVVTPRGMLRARRHC